MVLLVFLHYTGFKKILPTLQELIVSQLGNTKVK